MLPIDQIQQFNTILEELGKNLDITPAQYQEAVRSYEFVGGWLADSASPLHRYKPVVSPHGSMLLGTMTQPIHEDDELDVDLICRLEGKRTEWTQYDLKNIVGDRLKDHGTFKRLLRPEGRRCWTLGYAEEARFHLDILPAIVAYGHNMIMEKAFTEYTPNAEELAIRITDRTLSNYRTDTDTLRWLQSNPFGYAIWFASMCRVDGYKMFSLRNAVKPVPEYQREKTPLQRIVQLLKRHRDLMFNGDEDKPISIIITTLAAKAYRKQTNIAIGIVEVLNGMERYIEERYDQKSGKNIKWIANPVNPLENFADKWPARKAKEDNFYRWLRKAQQDMNHLYQQKGMPYISAAMGAAFGSQEVTKTFRNLGTGELQEREKGSLKMAGGTGILGETGRTTVLPHSPYGTNE